MVVDAIHVTALKKGILDKTRIMRKLKKKQSEESSCQARVRSVATTFDNIRHPWHRIRFPNHLQMLTSDIGAKFRRLFFFNSVQNNDCHFPFAGPQQAKRNHVPFLSRNAKICIISLEGTLRLDPTNLIFGLQTTTQ